MGKKIIFLLLITAAVIAGLSFLDIGTIVMLVPKGEIAAKQKSLLVIATLLMLIVIVPVFIASILIAWRYHEENKKAKYDPSWENNNLAEFIWWMVPCVIIAVLSVLTWKSCYELNPFAPIKSETRPLKIQVIALQWKWLFIYPEQNIATVSYVQFPKETPLDFEITGDAPMNSFWIPQLGGQIYAMPAMRSELHLIAHEEGVFSGFSAHLSGKGFSGMTFQAKSCSQQEFDAWVQQAKMSPDVLNQVTYDELRKPSEYVPPQTFLLQKQDLFETVIMNYMMPMDQEIK